MLAPTCDKCNEKKEGLRFTTSVILLKSERTLTGFRTEEVLMDDLDSFV